MIAEETFPGEPASVRAARSLVATALPDLGEEQVESLQLMVSELATNAVRHADAPFQVSIRRADSGLRVEVFDEGPGTPVKGSPDPTMPSGRGLIIVDALADSWGVDQHPREGKTVWFTLQLAEEDRQERSGSRPAPNTADASR
ncbi:MAG: ATP-binding protein [Acidimicrobiales bacterium]